MAVLFNVTRINDGGMMRCCTQSLAEAKELDDECLEGEVVRCRYADDSDHSHPHWLLVGRVWMSNQNPRARSAS